ncbi:hypothetical protein FQN57_002267 [Myotisia sp. PD_48]|nr:hypothetical protein FQN57_002267 [Myotisia sp. PD_48]
MSEIPVIDFASFLQGTPEQAQNTAKQVFEAFRDVGFAYLSNHGVPQSMVDKAFIWSKRFFSLPQSEKDKAPHPDEGANHRGYSRVGREKVSQMVFDQSSLDMLRKVPDEKESFDIGYEDDDEGPANIWPPEESIPEFRKFFTTEFYPTCHMAGLDILRALAAGMGLDERHFHLYHSKPANQIRLLHYPAVEEAALRGGEKERIGAHTDFGTLTLLFQDEVGGLEVERINQDGKGEGGFVPAPYVKGTMVVNIGDLLMRWSNDVLHSTTHRVRAPPASTAAERDRSDEEGGRKKMVRERYSIPYFIAPVRDAVVDCLPGCCGPERPKKYEPIAAWEYLNMRMNASY